MGGDALFAIYTQQASNSNHPCLSHSDGHADNHNDSGGEYHSDFHGDHHQDS